MRSEVIVYAIGIPLIGYWLYQAISSGQASVKGGDVGRQDEPIRYWAFVIIMLVMLGGAIAWLIGWFVWRVDIGRP
jgi:hypothetical protein